MSEEHASLIECPLCEGEGGIDLGKDAYSSCGERLGIRCYYCAGTGWAVGEVPEQHMDDCDPWPPPDCDDLLRTYEAAHE